MVLHVLVVQITVNKYTTDYHIYINHMASLITGLIKF